MKSGGIVFGTWKQCGAVRRWSGVWRPGLMLVLGVASIQPSAGAAGEPGSWVSPQPLGEAVAQATARYEGDSLKVSGEGAGARLRCVFQKLEGEVTRGGLWLTSTVDGAGLARFRVVAVGLGRGGEDAGVGGLWGAGGAMLLGSEGRVSVEGQRVRYERPGLVEEYSVSVEGVRQDFVVSEKPGLGTGGALRLELGVEGARVEPLGAGVRLVLAGSGRKIAYHRLRVTDASGKELSGRMEVGAGTGGSDGGDGRRLAIVVEDAEAEYPIRIDPTFSDANWVSFNPGANNAVHAAVVDEAGNLYIGGEFTNVGGVGANRIAKWNGSSWSALGSGMNGTVRALAVSGTDLYAGGDFTATGDGGTTLSRIAKWDGSSWSALGGGVNGTVNALAVLGGNLYAGGSFGTAGGVPASRIAKWDGSSWSTLGSGIRNGTDGTVRALAVSGSNLYAGGDFTRAGGVTVNRIAKWNGSSWSALGSGMNYTVYALAVSGSDLYAGGAFWTAGGGSANCIAKWNGSGWSALGSGMGGTVFALAVSGSDLYAGGNFTTAGGVSANYIAKWDGSGWSALGSGMHGLVSALAVSGSDLYAGGFFTTAGGKDSPHVALLTSLAASDATYSRGPGISLKIRIADIAWDVNGLPVTVESAGPSAQGATISWNNMWLYYQPANDNNDSFSYTVSNGSSSRSGTITVNVVRGGGLAKTITVSGGSVTVQFFGIPGITYDVQRTTSLSEPVTWVTLNTTALEPAGDGSFTFTDTDPPPGTAYYRSVQH